MLGRHGDGHQRVQHVVASDQGQPGGLAEAGTNDVELRAQDAAQHKVLGAVVARMLDAVERDLP